MSRRALVTGANRGIGRAVAAALVARGLTVFVAGRDEAGVREAADELGAEPVRLDVTDQAAVDRALTQAGAIDILVNNAGILDEGQDPVVEDLDRVETLLSTNLMGAWRMCHAFVPGMVDRDWGRVVNVSSGAGQFAHGLWPAAPAYSVSKAGLNALTLVWAERLADTNIKVNAISPGVVGTRMAPYSSRTPEEAAVEIVDLALLPDDGPSGRYFSGGEPQPW